MTSHRGRATLVASWPCLSYPPGPSPSSSRTSRARPSCSSSWASDRYAEMLAEHERLLRAAFAAHGGGWWTRRAIRSSSPSARLPTPSRPRSMLSATWPPSAGRTGRSQGAHGPAHGRAAGGRAALRRHRRPSRRAYRRGRPRRPGAALVDDEGAGRGRPPAGCLDSRPGRAAPEGHRQPQRLYQLDIDGLAERVRAAEDARRRAAPQDDGACTPARR